MAKKINFDPNSIDFKAGLERGNLAGAAEMARLLSIQAKATQRAYMNRLMELDKQNPETSGRDKKSRKS